MELKSKSKLEDLIRDENGQSMVGPLVAVTATIIATPVCAYLGSYVGEGIGYAWGNVVDFIPYVRDVAPWLAERTGLINDAKKVVDLNENLYQTSGAVAGFWGGLFLPLRILIKNTSDY